MYYSIDRSIYGDTWCVTNKIDRFLEFYIDMIFEIVRADNVRYLSPSFNHINMA